MRMDEEKDNSGSDAQKKEKKRETPGMTRCEKGGRKERNSESSRGHISGKRKKSTQDFPKETRCVLNHTRRGGGFGKKTFLAEGFPHLPRGK